MGLKSLYEEVLVNTINFLLYFAIQESLIFIPLLGSEMGATDLEIGFVGSAYGTAFLISSLFFGWKSDTLGRLVFVRIGLLVSSLAFLTQLFINSLLMLIFIRAFVGFAVAISTAALIAYVYENTEHLGKFSSYGSLGWIAGAVSAGLLKEYHLLFALSFAGCFLAFFMSLRLKEAPKKEEQRAPELLGVVHRNFQVYLAIFLRHLGAASVWIIMPLYLVSLGADRFWIGMLSSINFVVQFIVMRYIEKFDKYKVFTLGQVLSIIVFFGYGFATYYLQLISVQIALGVSWSCLYVGALQIILSSGEERGTAGGVFQSTLHLCNAVGPFLGGIIAQGWGYRGVMFSAAIIGTAGLFTAMNSCKEEKLKGEQP